MPSSNRVLVPIELPSRRVQVYGYWMVRPVYSDRTYPSHVEHKDVVTVGRINGDSDILSRAVPYVNVVTWKN